MTEPLKTTQSNGHRWQKGQSGNPGGRPKLPKDALELANAASPDAIRRAIELTRHKDPRVALKAIELVLDRGLGKPHQSVELNDVSDRPAIILAEPMTPEQWQARFGPETPEMGHGD